MAYMQKQYCSKCGKPDALFISSAGRPFREQCISCESNEADVEKVTYLAKQGFKPLDQRLAEIEEWIYEQEHKPYSSGRL